jgi:hypothetical protein
MFAKLFAREQPSNRGRRLSDQKGAAALVPAPMSTPSRATACPLRSNGPIWSSIDPGSNIQTI